MIVAGFILLAVGATDLVRRFAPVRRRWVAFAVLAALLVLASAGLDAFAAALAAVAAAVLWVTFVPADRTGRAGLWPVAVLGAACVISVASLGPRGYAGPLGMLWRTDAPLGELPPDVVVLIAGVVLFLTESANLVVRAALRAEMTADAEPDTPATLRGGRLIGPLERILVFGLTLAGAYTLLAAVLAAKGIVRFPEISRDGERGSRAEYFLVGSLVSWVAALAAAFLVWWGSGAGWSLGG